MPEWQGEQLDLRRKQALGAFRSSMSDMLDHKEWVQLTELLWQHLSDKIADVQLDVMRRERFDSSKEGLPIISHLSSAKERLNKFTKYKRALRALNFLFKCFEVDWTIFRDTIIDLAEGNQDAKGLDRQTKRDQSSCSAITHREESDNTGSG